MKGENRNVKGEGGRVKGENEVENKKRDLPERTFKFAVQIVKLCKILDKTIGTSRVLPNQLLRSGTSIGANIEEGQVAEVIIKKCRESVK